MKMSPGRASLSPDEVRLHLEQAEEKLVIAREMLDNGHLGEAAGRAYYAMFHAAQALLKSKNLQAKTHRGTFGLLGEHFVGRSALTKQDARNLKLAMELREEGDYGIDFQATEAEVKLGLDRARTFIEHAKETLGAQT